MRNPNPRRSWRSWHRLPCAIAIAGVLAAAGAGPARAFGLEDVIERAKQLATQPYRDPHGSVPRWLLSIPYDQWRGIRFRPERALWRERGLPFTVQFFHPGLFYDRTVDVHIVTPSGVESAAFAPDQFDYGTNEFGSRVPQDLGYAGFRVHYPIKRHDYQDEVVAFLGASYFRAVGRQQVYGLSARGIAIDTALPSGEEFPWFREYWLVRPGSTAQELTFYALLDSPSITGAYRFVVAPGPQTRIDVELRLFPRTAIHKLGVAPLTSMYLRGENGAARPIDDYRPEIHDSDGLLLAARSGEWLWRALENPKYLRISSFQAENPRGFGLLQRDRNFDHYQDFGARPDLRPSAWIVPRGDWGAGRVELVEIPTDDDTNDNVVAYWVPTADLSPSHPASFAYSIFWYGDDRTRPPGGRTVATRKDSGTEGNSRRLVVDFEGDALRSLPENAVVEGVITVASNSAEGGENAQPAEILEQQVMRNPVTKGWRLVFRVKSPDDGPVELRAFLRYGEGAITETWSYLLNP
jgi:periplasmic glucans biosynthesis protein